MVKYNHILAVFIHSIAHLLCTAITIIHTMEKKRYKLEPLTAAHGAAVMDIFNYYIEQSVAAYLEKPLPVEFFPTMLEKTAGYPAYAIQEKATAKTVGFCYLKPYHPFPTFKETAEITYFIAPEHVGKGVGKLALDALELDARYRGIKHILASISSLNEQSLAFHRKNGFTQCGCFKGIGIKNSTPFDMVWMEKHIE